MKLNNMVKAKQKFVIIDGNALLHRAYHALPPLLTKDGTLVNAVYGFATTLLKIFREIDPQYLAVTFDKKGPTFRHKEYKEYKATREKKPDELYNQIGYIKELLVAMQVPYFEAEGFEADDVIATLAARASKKKDLESLIVTGDMDTLQLVSPAVKVYAFRKGLSDVVIYDEKAVKERYGLEPEQLIDFKGLRGDPSDNLPGVKGIGEVGAAELIKKFGSIENLYKELEDDTPAAKKISPRLRDLLIREKDAAVFGKRMVVLVKDVPLEFSLKQTEKKPLDNSVLLPVLQKFGFRSLAAKLQGAEDGGKKETKKTKSAPPGPVSFIDKEAKALEIIQNKQSRDIFLRVKTNGGKIIFVGISSKEEFAVITDPSDNFLAAVDALFHDSGRKIYGHDIKSDMHSLGIVDPQCAFFDFMVASYLADPGSRAHDFRSIIFSSFGKVLPESSGQQTLISDLAEEARGFYEEIRFSALLEDKFKKILSEREQLKLFEEMEMPLLPVLYEMERKGILIDTDFLSEMSENFAARIEDLQKEIFKLAGEEFNVNSPAQLGKVLFEKLKISSKTIKKTAAGGALSTAAAELEKLRGAHPVVDLVFEYRELAKLKSTYIDALPGLIDKEGRVHTTFNQAVTATGRLSSSNPNLQNIPVKTDLGREIRKAFVARRGYSLIAADYSQIELRIAAHLSGDAKMIENFMSGEDIHTRTAQEIWNVGADEVKPEMRRVAKAINFGVIYGMGPRKLAQSANVSMAEANEFIGRFFAIHDGLRQYLDDLKDLAAAQGYVETMFGRRRYLPEIVSGVPMLRAEAERQATNTPIQGTSADIIKMAMIGLHDRLKKDLGAGAEMLLQVHDELVFEVVDSKLSEARALIREAMENAVKLRVPINVEIEVGKNWGEMR